MIDAGGGKRFNAAKVDSVTFAGTYLIEYLLAEWTGYQVIAGQLYATASQSINILTRPERKPIEAARFLSPLC